MTGRPMQQLQLHCKVGECTSLLCLSCCCCCLLCCQACLSACRQSCNVAGGVGGGGGGKQLALLHKSEDMQCSRPSCSWSVAPAVPGTPSAAWVDTLPCRWSAQLTLAQNFQRSSHNISHICRRLLERGKRVKNIYWFNSQFRKVGTSTSSK